MPSRARSFPSDLGVYGLPGDVSPRRIDFDPSERAHLDREPGGGYRIRVWADPDLSEGLVVTGPWKVGGHPLRAMGGGLWEAVLPLSPGTRFSLAFRSPEGKGVYFTADGIAVAVERLDRWVLPDLAPISVPGWAKGALIYQIFPDRFDNADPSIDPTPTDPWGSPPHPRRFQGGDLPGVTRRLAYLSNLGVEALYLTPVFASPSNHRYDALDYYEVDPALGGNQALLELVGEAHARNIRVILDASFNHTHPGFFAFADLVRRGPSSPYRDWFVIFDWPVRLRIRGSGGGHWQDTWEHLGVPVERVAGPGPRVEPTYETWYGVPSMPRVNLANPEARRYFLEVAAHWVRDYHVDGWRMDVARYVDADFWVDFRSTVKAVRPDAYLLAEIMGDASSWLQGDRFDATMNYSFRDLCVRFFGREAIDGGELLAGLSRLWGMYPAGVALVNQNLIGSHDTPRFRTEAGGHLWRLRLATVLQMTFPGAPGIYYGDELGLEGGWDPGSRVAFPWDVRPEGREPFETIRSLQAVRRRSPVWRVGDWQPLEGRGGLVVFERYLGRRRLAVAINRGRRGQSVDLPFPGRVAWGKGEVDGRRLTLPAREAAVVARSPG